MDGQTNRTSKRQSKTTKTDNLRLFSTTPGTKKKRDERRSYCSQVVLSAGKSDSMYPAHPKFAAATLRWVELHALHPRGTAGYSRPWVLHTYRSLHWTRPTSTEYDSRVCQRKNGHEGRRCTGLFPTSTLMCCTHTD